MRQMTVGATLLCVLFLQQPAAAQQPGSIDLATALSLQAERSFEQGDVLQLRQAGEYWAAAGNLYESAGEMERAAAVRYRAGSAYAQIGETETALSFLGRGLVSQSPSARNDISFLIEQSPTLFPTLSLEREASFIAAVKELLAGIPNGSDLADEISSTEGAMEAVEAMATHSSARITIVSAQPRFGVAFRRWKHRNSSVIAWEEVRTDTSVVRAPAQYQFRYVDPTSGVETIIDRPCANDCTISVPPTR